MYIVEYKYVFGERKLTKNLYLSQLPSSYTDILGTDESHLGRKEKL